jgi:hypothetical protein
VLLVPDGVSVRNFILTDLVDRLAERGPVSVLRGDAWVDDPPAAIDQVEQLAPYPERPVEAMVRRALEYAHMRCWSTTAMRFNLERKYRGSARHRAVVGSAAALARPFASPAGVQRLAALHERLAAGRPEVAFTRGLLTAWRPDVLLCAHHRPLSTVPAVLAARQLGIPTASFIFSWDNLTTKGRIAVPYDHYFVWSEHMAGELARFYPDVARERVHVVGTPQFEPYGDASLQVGRDEFLAAVGIDGSQPVVCFSGGDHATCPEDPAHLSVLLDAVRSGRIGGDPVVVARPAPVDDGRRYDAVRAAHPELVWCPPAWTRGANADWTAVAPTRADVAFLANLTRHADVNVNMASTMTLDFALRDRPVVNLGFDVADPPPLGEPVSVYYSFDHYRPVVDTGAARVAKDPDELASLVDRYLGDAALDRDRRRALVDLEVGVPPGHANRAIVSAMDSIAS